MNAFFTILIVLFVISANMTKTKTMNEMILSCFKYKAVISDDGLHCKVIDPDGVVRGENLTTQQALDLRYELYEREVDAHNRRAELKQPKQLTLNF